MPLLDSAGAIHPDSAILSVFVALLGRTGKIRAGEHHFIPPFPRRATSNRGFQIQWDALLSTKARRERRSEDYSAEETRARSRSGL
jgi:hypothetical protein